MVCVVSSVKYLKVSFSLLFRKGNTKEVKSVKFNKTNIERRYFTKRTQQ